MAWSFNDSLRVRHLILGLTLICASTYADSTLEVAPKPLRVRAQLSAPPYFVGQSITLQVSVVAHEERPIVATPKLNGAEVSLRGVDLRPLTGSGIGNIVHETNQFLYLYRVVPQKAGILKVPGISARLGDRVGVSEPLRLSIEKLPEWDRPRSFLGGVGAFDLSAEVDSTRVQAGQSFEYRLRVTGPAALGMNRRPLLSPSLQEVAEVRSGTEGDEFISEPPARTYRYRLRPTRAGTLIVPPVTIAAFDPKLRRYMTKVSPSVSIEVVDVPRFDPSLLDYVHQPTPTATGIRGRIVTGVVGVILCFGCVVMCCRRWLKRRGLRSRWVVTRFLKQFRRDFNPTVPTTEVARQLTEALATCLELTAGRPRGPLTPAEARVEFTRVALNDELAERMAGFVALCDQVQYSGAGPSTSELLAKGWPLFEELGRLLANQGGRERALIENRERQLGA